MKLKVYLWDSPLSASLIPSSCNFRLCPFLPSCCNLDVFNKKCANFVFPVTAADSLSTCWTTRLMQLTQTESFSVYVSGKVWSGISNCITLCSGHCWFMQIRLVRGQNDGTGRFSQAAPSGHFMFLRVHKIWPLYIPSSYVLCMLMYAWEVCVV